MATCGSRGVSSIVHARRDGAACSPATVVRMDNMGERWEEDADSRRQHLAVAVAVGMAAGLALSVATGYWRMIAVGLVLGLCLGLAYHNAGRADGPDERPAPEQGHLP